MFTKMIRINKLRMPESFTNSCFGAIIVLSQRGGDTEMKIRGNKAIVTGGSRGIGLKIAKELAEAGVSVVITGRNADSLSKAAAESGAVPVVWDISDINRMKEKFDECVGILGGFDILVNNAGVFDTVGWGMGMLNVTEEDWDRVMDVNLKAAFFMMQTAVKYMLGNKIRGNILNISSVAANEPLQGPYGASKAGLFGLTRGWGKVLAPTGIIVNGIAPGPVATEMNGWHEGDPLDHSRIPTGRFVLAEEVAKLAMYLLSEDAVQIIGHSVVCDGAYDIK